MYIMRWSFFYIYAVGIAKCLLELTLKLPANYFTVVYRASYHDSYIENLKLLHNYACNHVIIWFVNVATRS